MTVHPRRVVVMYYRLRAINPDTTLKRVCELMGANYQTVRNYKVLYDASRRKKVPKVRRPRNSGEQDDQNT